MTSPILNIYPNPTGKIQNLLVESEKESRIIVDIYDIMGRLLRTVYDGKTSGTVTNIKVDIGDLPNSLYFYYIRMDDKIICRKFIKN